MENMIFNKEVIHEIESSGEIKALDDMYMIEDVALNIKEWMKKIDFLKGYKKQKVEDVNKEIAVTENKIEFFKQVILSTLNENKEKSLRFPGSCQVISRKGRDKWVIKDDDSFIELLEEYGEKDEIVEEIIQYKIIKKEADKLLVTWEKNGTLESVSSEIVEKENGKPSVTIKYEDESDEEIIDETPVPTKEAVPTEFDQLEGF